MELSEYIDEFGAASATVTKVAVQAKRRDRVSVFVDGEFAFGVADEVAVRHGIRSGKVLTAPILKELQREDQTASCKRVALHYISYRFRSETEVRRRLVKEGASPEAIDTVIEHLRGLDLVDDTRFAAAYARDAVIGRKWGPHKIAKGLRQAGVCSPDVEHALTEVRHLLEDENLVSTLAEKRWNQLSDVEDLIKRKKRVYDHLLRRGFDFDEVRRAVDSLGLS